MMTVRTVFFLQLFLYIQHICKDLLVIHLISFKMAEADVIVN